MKRQHALLVIVLTMTLASCGPALQPASTSPASTIVATSPPAASALPPTASPPQQQGLSPTELKYRLLAEFPNLFFCDPDSYPVARTDEMTLAKQAFADLQANTEEFQAILSHNGLSGASSFTDEQKLLIYREHKKLGAITLEPTGDVNHFQLQTADGNQGLLIKGLIDAGGKITVQERTPTFATCPICLAAWTLIDTPGGAVRVTDLEAGDLVWTVNTLGQRIAAPVLEVSSTQVPTTHEMVHVSLSDGRELWASAGHPTTDGRSLGDLKVRNALDGAFVRSAERVLYGLPATYDLLPAGPTGFYWANGILVGSTLAGRAAP